MFHRQQAITNGHVPCQACSELDFSASTNHEQGYKHPVSHRVTPDGQ